MAINWLLKNKDEIIRLCEKVMNKRCDISDLEDQKAKLQAELEVTCCLMERLIAMNAAKAMNQDEYNRQFAEYEARYNEIRQRIADVESEQKQRIAKRGKLAKYLETLSTSLSGMRLCLSSFTKVSGLPILAVTFMLPKGSIPNFV